MVQAVLGSVLGSATCWEMILNQLLIGRENDIVSYLSYPFHIDGCSVQLVYFYMIPRIFLVDMRYSYYDYAYKLPQFKVKMSFIYILEL